MLLIGWFVDFWVMVFDIGWSEYVVFGYVVVVRFGWFWYVGEEKDLEIWVWSKVGGVKEWVLWGVDFFVGFELYEWNVVGWFVCKVVVCGFFGYDLYFLWCFCVG